MNPDRRGAKKAGLNFNRKEKSEANPSQIANLIPGANNMIAVRTRKPKKQTEQEKYTQSAFHVPEANGKLLELAHSELKTNDYILSFLGLVACGLTILQNDLFYENGNQTNTFINQTRSFVIGISFISVIWVFRRYQMLLTIEMIHYKWSPSDSLISSGLIKMCLLEALIFSFAPIPGLDTTFEAEMLSFRIEYSYDTVITFFVLLRVYTVSRIFGHYSVYTQSRAQRVCKANGETASVHFAFKAFINESPFKGIILVFILVSLFWAICLRLCEKPDRIYTVDGVDTVESSNLKDYTNNVWLVFVSTTTVGYGDMYPMTHLGRSVVVLACIVGNVFLGVLIVSLQTKTKHTPEEKIAYTWISRYDMRKVIKENAALCIQRAYRMYRHSMKVHPAGKNHLKPNEPVQFFSVFLRGDLHYMSEEDFKVKSRNYFLMKTAMRKLYKSKKEAREIGMDNVDIIKYIDDSLSVDLNDIAGKMKYIATENQLLQMSSLIQQQRELHSLALSFRDSYQQLVDSYKLK